MTCRSLWILLIGISVVFEAGAASRKIYGGTAYLPVLEDFASTDPGQVDSMAAWLAGRQLHETLFRSLSDGRVIPVLASEAPVISRDGRSWLIRLRPGLRFHDGSTIDSWTFSKSWHRLLEPKTASPHWWLLAPVEGAVEYHSGKHSKISGIEVINALEMRVRLRYAMPGFLEALCALPTAPLPRRVLRDAAGVFHPPGSGPFRFSDGPSSPMVPFLRHPLGRPYLDELVWKRHSSAKEAALAFELDGLHLSPEMPRSMTSEQRILDTLANRMVFLVLNGERLKQFPAGFAEAVHISLDRRALVSYLVGDRGRPIDEMLLRPEDKGGEVVQVQQEKARAYFRQLMIQRVGIGPVLEFIVGKEDAFARAVAERIQLNLQDVGLSVQIVQLDPETFRQRRAKGEFDLGLARPIPWVADPVFQLVGIVASLQSESDVLDVFDSLSANSDEQSRVGLARERARRIVMQMTWIPLMVYGDRWAVQAEVRDLQVDGQGVLDFSEVWFGK